MVSRSKAEKPYAIGLSIGHEGGKAIPYGPRNDPQPDGSDNFGFKLLKGALHRIDEIPEAQEDQGLRQLLLMINAPSTGLVTVGCDRGVTHDENGHRIGGYLEFAINSVEIASDAANYFPLFFHFDQLLRDQSFDVPVNFHWELEGSYFWQAGANCFTATVWMRLAYLPTEAEAHQAWQKTTGILGDYLAGAPPAPGTPLFNEA